MKKDLSVYDNEEGTLDPDPETKPKPKPEPDPNPNPPIIPV